ncbi:tyrosine-type recombinase/integrase [Clostridium intestinale]|nr:tyrosine-type recombinase/integrase [Clostridium intestinale]
MPRKVPANSIPERSYNRFKYKLEEMSREYPERNLMMFYIGVATGYRTQDIVDLTIGQIKESLEDERFIIQEKKQYKAWETHMKNYPNSKKKRPPPREVMIKPNLRKLLREYIKGKSKSEYAFPSNKNEHISAKSYSEILNTVGKSLGLKNISGHSMRKTYASRLWEAKRDLEYVRIALGHMNIETTKRYLGLDNEIKDDAAALADDKL